MTVKVTLRKKPITEERMSLYLDFYPAITNPKTGKTTRRDFLKMYISLDKTEVKKEIDLLKEQGNDEKLKELEAIYKKLKPLTEQEKLKNQEQIKIAEQIRDRIQNELNKPEIYTEFERAQLKAKAIGEQNFMEYYKKVENQREGSNYESWRATRNYLELFTGGQLKFSDITVSFCNDFKRFLLTTKTRKSKKVTLTQNSASTYFNIFKGALKQAFKDELLPVDISARVEALASEETNREYLSYEELVALGKTECPNPLLKRAALFSALTGLRHCDIKKLTWGEIRKNENGYLIQFRQKKTRGAEVLPISDDAYRQMGKQRKPDDLVFDGLHYSAYQNELLYKWVEDAGITRHITFHSFRHTYATLMLEKTDNIYLVQKMLGHRKLQATQIYAKIVDKTKREAANAIKFKY